jgi:hypothetical protein
MNGPGQFLQSKLRGTSYCPPTVSRAAAPPESSRVRAELCPIAFGPAPVRDPCAPWVGGIVPIQQQTAPVYVPVQTRPASFTTATRAAAAAAPALPAAAARFVQYRSTYVEPPPPTPSLPNPVPVVTPPQCLILRYEGSKPPSPPT